MESMDTFRYPELQDLSEDLNILGGRDKPLRTSRTASAPPECSRWRGSRLIEEIPDKAILEKMQGTTEPKTVSYDDSGTPSMYRKEGLT
jgi:hypothetical protein